ncbi:expressed protein [Batrachochytrium dendrobatidis JAM81]|uniref:Expressed protein n=1 Tax=Batrachochytrium dendrobatidis (strain JAM81 / FGSC 10211) TaxID=684364 RepID=F4P917_BATDJ|nr:uncharacterized protein BATDEDRAFT_35743 [Batrachochytrium dendrobatidis JAM81]EGF78263.1 expressed protein [Batrachochytrium dendrobatidis JAM81]KAJ8331179.1 hypothetical protein O5D80_000744 [Batrachochytrium dendrobatidis]KAK5667662.1 hypothetical protein QVD99_005775 [Batrachochytrium dendrobatidis]|eukprot:XP_006681143.1 expressed protein [Batrachochytrium dendrobatidis JAM81]
MESQVVDPHSTPSAYLEKSVRVPAVNIYPCINTDDTDKSSTHSLTCNHSLANVAVFSDSVCGSTAIAAEQASFVPLISSSSSTPGIVRTSTGAAVKMNHAENGATVASLTECPVKPASTTSSPVLVDIASPKLIPTKSRSGLDARKVQEGEFEAERHFYPRVLNANIHPLVSSFFSLGNERILARYTHLNPQVNLDSLKSLLKYKPKYFQWAGSDLFHVTTAEGQRQMIIVETNSCPSGQKSMPLLSEIGEEHEHGGYGIVIDSTFCELAANADKSLGDLAVVCDKNMMEASGYAAVLADTVKETVWLAEYYVEDPDPPVKWIDGLMYLRDEHKTWHPIRACFRYVTQKPWNRIPINSKTIVLNSIVSCLAGGRNKMMASRAYDFFNSELTGTGMAIRMPETIRNVTKSEIPLWIDSMGGHAVLKVPYSNAGQGVYTITNKKELDDFMNTDHFYDKFIVQSLVGNASWSSVTRAGKFFHVGTIPNKKNHTYVSDLRMMVTANSNGFRPVACYARKARTPLCRNLEDHPELTSWEMLGTNLSVKTDGEWTTEAQRLLLMDRKDFNHLGIGIDDLIDAYIQTVLSVIAIDKMAQRLMKDAPSTAPRDPNYPWYNEKIFDFELFEALNPDKALLDEIVM